jgi:multidrug efflux pump subunit AcrA (membrane-fusion protein)
MKLSSREKRQRPQAEKVKPTVFVKGVKNEVIPIYIQESGRLTSKNRIEIYAEVQGVMEVSRKEFKPGTRFRKGETMVRIRNNDFYANLQAQKSVLQNLITGALPDLRIDYPESYQKWDNYIKNFDMDKPIGKLPEPSSDKEKYFITGKNIYTTYYNTKNQEIILQKYVLKAPFDGVLIDALVNPGTVVRPGQRLGELIDPSVYELEVAISKSYLPDLTIGKQVTISDINDGVKTWQGKISRINGRVNPMTQTVQVFIEVRGDELREGMFLNASISAKPKENAFEIARSLLINDNNLYVVEDSTLRMLPIDVVHRTTDTVVVRGLADGLQVVTKPVAGAYSGMAVIVNKTDK